MATEPASPRLLTLLRAAFHLRHHNSEAELVQAILIDAVAVLEAQRGAVALVDETDRLQVRAKVGDLSGKFHFSRALGERCFQSGESILCGAVDSADFAPGEIDWVMCLLLSTPRRRLGVLHLDRNRNQPAFTRDDLQFVDAIAAILAAGIEGVRKGGRG